MTDDRSAQAIVALGLFDGTKTNIFTGTINGIIAQHPFGSGGFGWDTIFIPDGYTQTRAEMNEKDYDATSPRLKALEALMQFVKED